MWSEELWGIKFYFFGGVESTKDCSWLIRRIFKCREVVSMLPEWNLACAQRIYNTRAICDALRGQKITVPCKHMVMGSLARPRAVFYCWLYLHGRLPTKDRLTRFGISNDGVCAFVVSWRPIRICFNIDAVFIPLWRSCWPELNYSEFQWEDVICGDGLYTSPRGRVWLRRS